MPLIVVGLFLFVLLAAGGIVLLSLALRYRAGTARRQARPWAVKMNLWLTAFSAFVFLCVSFLMSFWLGPTLRFAVLGMGSGALLGLFGLALSRWESKPEGIFYTPSRWLALLITLAITGRIAYGWWHATHPADPAPAGEHWLMTATGMQLSLAVAAGLIGYYLVYALGVRLKLAHYERARSHRIPSRFSR